ncbi:MAG: zf-HC2 domain-containing protein [Sedimentisphaerales bacterium]|nr:zf-HC2 domain-containing protein [Sedimentisphaerales bacterium]
MMGKTCEDIQEMLVDYADGELSPEQSSEVTGHLGQCENCRRLLEALQKSLELAGVIWEDGLAEEHVVKMPDRKKAIRIHWLRYAAVAASILIVVTTSIVWNSFRKQKEPQLSYEQIERSIADSAKAARLLAATELLSDYPDTKDIVEQQYQYIVKTYPETPSAAKIKLKNQ